MTLKKNILLIVLLSAVVVAAAQNYGNIEFIENKGQWNSKVRFRGDVDAGAFFIRDGGFTVMQHNRDDYNRLREYFHPHRAGTTQDSFFLRGHAYNVDFLGASPQMHIIPDKALPTYNNYFIGNDPSKWASDCKIYQGITLENVYPNVNVRYYTDKGTLKYDIVVKPGADISKIALKYEGVDKLEVKNRELQIKTSVGNLRESEPYTYQYDGKGKKEISCKYIVRNNIVRFDVKGYDPTTTLIIDPTLIFCSFTGSQVDNWGFTATYGPDGSMFGGGIVFGSGFPSSPGAYQIGFQGGNSAAFEPCDIGIIKLTPDGTNRVYATYLGGSGNELPGSLVVDNQGNLIVAGRSNSPNYPTYPNNNIGINNPQGNWDIIVTKLNATGTALIGSKKIGGAGMDGGNITEGSNGIQSLNRNYGDEIRSEVLLDAAGNIYVASCTQSSSNDPNLKFPVTAGAFQTTFGGGLQDGVVLKFDSNLSTLLFSSFLGGDGNDAAYVLAIGPSGDIYVAGGTESHLVSNVWTNSFPGNHAGTIGANPGGGIDGFIAQISNNGSSIIRSTFLGTSQHDQIFGIQFDQKGFVYVMGQTEGDWPVINATFQNANSKQFIAKIKPDLSAYVYSTVFGSGTALPNISPTAFLVDRCENVYVSGWGGPIIRSDPLFYPNGGTAGLPVTADAFQSTTDNADFYFFVLKRDATAQLFGSFFGKQGGTVADHVDGGTSRFDRNGVIYQGICGDCGAPTGGPFPTTPGVWAYSKPPNVNCNQALVKIKFDFSGVEAGVRSTINGVVRDSSGCVPLTVHFSDTVRNAVTYEWNFGDGSPSITTTIPDTAHTYNSPGTFLVRLIAIDSNSCNIRDTSYMHIRVGIIKANLNFTPVKLAPCDSFKYRFDNFSASVPIRPFGSQSFIWDFGDGSPRVLSGSSSVFHNYTGPGTYNVKLILVDTNYCNAPDSITLQLSVAALVKARFNTPASGCLPYNAVFTNASIGGQTFQWDFGDGTTSSATSPTHLYSSPGTYTITLIANDPNTCNLTDTTRFTISVFSNPTAGFSFTPDPPIENSPTTFTNLSSPDAISFKWKFGDGDSLQTTSRLPIQHQYNVTGTYTTCLTAINANGCADTICQPVRALIAPLVDVPNAFTPQSGDINSVIMVRGFGIVKMRFIIWNRWGQKVFETTDRLQGWDGKYKGVLQPMDVYAYTLEVEFFDGTKASKKGDITLIR